MTDPVIELRGASKHFGSYSAVRDLDLDVPKGQCFGLLGPNGAGKTTTLRMIYGVTRPSAGSVRVFGLDVALRPREGDHPAPRFIEQELRAYLRCGILAHGFLRLHCDACGHDRLVPFP